MAEKDFIGFTFDGVRSDDLGIVRVSDGDRFDEQLHPEIKDLTAEVPGMHGEYYFGSTYGNKEIEIKIAYDSLTEVQFRKLRHLFSGNEIRELIFDERPYKKYLVKLASPIELNYVCFNEQKRVEGETIHQGGVRYKKGIKIREDITPWVYETDQQGNPVMERRYKGEGTISLIAYFPFAKSAFKVLPTYVKTKDTDIVEGKNYFRFDSMNRTYNIVLEPLKEELNEYYEQTAPEDMEQWPEWIESSRILSLQEYNENHIDQFIKDNDNDNGNINLYNAGDMKTGFRLYCPNVNYQTDTKTEQSISIFYVPYIGKEVTGILEIEHLVMDKEETGIIINTDNNLIEGVKLYTLDGFNVSYITSGNIYNNCITNGHFFKLEVNDLPNQATLTVSGTLATETLDIYYDYLYL